MALKVVRFSTLLLTALVAGMLLAILLIEVYAVRQLSASMYTALEQPKHAILTPLFSVVDFGAVLSTILVLFLTRRSWRSRAFVFTLAGLVFLAVVGAISITVNVPINLEIMDWSVENPPADWAETRDRWNLAHAFRTAAALLALVFQLLAVLSLAPPGEADRASRAEGRTMNGT